MLVLTRKVNQGIVIAGNIYIRVLGVERDRVKIGIAAPKEIIVLRQELVDRENAELDTGKNSTGSENSEVPSAATTPDNTPSQS